MKVNRRAFLGKMGIMSGVLIAMAPLRKTNPSPAAVHRVVNKASPEISGSRKSERELLKRLRDNCQGLITAQDMRDIVVTFFSEVKDVKRRL